MLTLRDEKRCENSLTTVRESLPNVVSVPGDGQRVDLASRRRCSEGAAAAGSWRGGRLSGRLLPNKEVDEPVLPEEVAVRVPGLDDAVGEQQQSVTRLETQLRHGGVADAKPDREAGGVRRSGHD